jgi:hypothetical protein
MAWTDEMTSGLEGDMDEAPRNHEGSGRETSATLIAPAEEYPLDDSVSDKPEYDDEPATPGESAQRAPLLWRGQRARILRTSLLALTLAALALLAPALLASNGKPTVAHRQPTATPQPTASPTPTLIPGFQFVADTEDGFTLQVPQDWSCTPTNPGIECRDNADAPNYKAQVQLPGDWTVPGGQPNADDASPWVNYALNAFSETPGQIFERAPGPTSVVTINGVRWQTGGGLISVDTSTGQGTPTATVPIHIRVQVYATIHNGRPYLVAVYAYDTAFTVAFERYYLPMLRSLQFTPARL